MVQRKLLEELGLFLVAVLILGLAFVPTISDNLQGAATRQEEIPQRYIVKYTEKVNDPDRVGILSLIEEKKSFATIPHKVIEVTPSEMQRLVEDGVIETYEEDSLVPFGASLRTADQMTNTTIIPSYTVNGVPLDGTGQTVCIVDTGLMTDHPYLNQQQIIHEECVVGGTDSQGNSYCPPDGGVVDDQGHGTMVTGIYAMNYSSYPGLVPGGKVVAIQAWAEGKIGRAHV